MKYIFRSRHSLGFKIFSAVFVLGALWVAGEYLTGKRTDTVEFIVALSAVAAVSIANLCLVQVELNDEKNEICLVHWCRFRKKTIELSSITDIYVERSHSVDNHHLIYVQTGKLRYLVYEKGGEKRAVETEIMRLYAKLCSLTGIPVRDYVAGAGE